MYVCMYVYKPTYICVEQVAHVCDYVESAFMCAYVHARALMCVHSCINEVSLYSRLVCENLHACMRSLPACT